MPACPGFIKLKRMISNVKKIKFQFVVIIIYYFLTQQVSGSNPNKNILNLSLGLSDHLLRDNLASPSAYKGLSLPFQISYSKLTQNHQHLVSFYYTKCTLKSATNHKTDFYKFNLQYRFLKQLPFISKNTLKIYLGGKWDYDGSEKVYYYSNQASSELYKQHFSSLSVNLFIEQNFNNSLKLQYEVALPFLTYIIHSGYSYSSPEKLIGKADYSMIEFLRSGTFTSVANFRSFQTTINLQKELSKKLTLSVAYHFLYYEYPYPRLLRFASNKFLTSIGWSF